MQFNRVIEVIIRNFDTKEEFKISSKEGFRIDFNYSEYLDQSSSSNTGSVNIYNLSIETFQRIGTRFRTEIEIICGYENEKTNTVDRLCIGGLVSKSRSRKDSDFVTELSFQTAIRELNTNNKISKSYAPKTRLFEILDTIGKYGGFDSFTVQITQEEVDRYGNEIIDIIQRVNFAYGVSFIGTPKQVFDQISEMFDLGYTIDARDPKHIIWWVKEEGWNKLLSVKDSLQIGYDKKSAIKITSDRGSAQVLRIDTGLIDTPYIETVETNTGYFEGLDDNEELIYQKPIEVKINSKGEVMKDKDGNVKYTKPSRDKKIARTVVNAKALINPKIKTNSWVKLENTYNQVDGFYRVRNIKYTGSTHENNFIMEMTLTMMNG